MGAVNCRDSNVYKCFSHSTGLPTYKNGEIDALLILPWAHSSSISSGRLRFSQEGKPKPTGVKSCSGGQNRQLGGYHSLSPLHQIHLWTSAVRAQKIGDYLASNEDPNSQWFVFLWEASEGWATWKKAGNHHYLFNACGHDIWVFQWENKDRSSCLSYEVRVSGKAVIKEAVTPGGTYTSVRDRIKHASPLDVLFTVVGGWNNNWNFGYTGHTSCGNWVTGISDTGDDYQVFFFLDPLGPSGHKGISNLFQSVIKRYRLTLETLRKIHGLY